MTSTTSTRKPGHDGPELAALEAGEPIARLAEEGRPEACGTSGDLASGAIHRFHVTAPRVSLEQGSVLLNVFVRFPGGVKLLECLCNLFFEVGHASLKAFIFFFKPFCLVHEKRKALPQDGICRSGSDCLK